MPKASASSSNCDATSVRTSVHNPNLLFPPSFSVARKGENAKNNNPKHPGLEESNPKWTWVNTADAKPSQSFKPRFKYQAAGVQCLNLQKSVSADDAKFSRNWRLIWDLRLAKTNWQKKSSGMRRLCSLFKFHTTKLLHRVCKKLLLMSENIMRWLVWKSEILRTHLYWSDLCILWHEHVCWSEVHVSLHVTWRIEMIQPLEWHVAHWYGPPKGFPRFRFINEQNCFLALDLLGQEILGRSAQNWTVSRLMLVSIYDQFEKRTSHHLLQRGLTVISHRRGLARWWW